MSTHKKASHKQDRPFTRPDELQNEEIREFVAERAEDTRAKGRISESTSRVQDDQNRMISEHNFPK